MKRIITCSDGTWNKPNTMAGGVPVHTNVQKIFNAINKQDVDLEKNGRIIDQIKFYDEGVGAEGNELTKMIDGATGKGIDENILAAYKFIIWNYVPGDDIYLFGFSRGAYTARSLAGLIRNCGILKDNNLDLIKEAYDIYRDRDNHLKKPDGLTAKKFRQDYAYTFDANDHNYRIKFIGVWDTVGSLGIPFAQIQWLQKGKYNFHDTTLSSMIEHAYHALAIDEKRGNFAPTLWKQSEKLKDTNIRQEMQQVWFPGVHSNIGGGYPNEGLSDITLQWMISKASATGLSFNDEYISKHIHPAFDGDIYDSDVFPFNLTRAAIRKICKTKTGNESISNAAVERMRGLPVYRPENISKQFLKANNISK